MRFILPLRPGSPSCARRSARRHYPRASQAAGGLDGAKYSYERNSQGDITGLLDSSGNEVVAYSYDSWGKLLSIGGSLKDTVGVKNPFRYRSYYYDTETGLYLLQSRYYNPEIGRFISKDDQSYHAGDVSMPICMLIAVIIL